jgi:hypothetical protein
LHEIMNDKFTFITEEKKKLWPRKARRSIKT